MPNSSPGRSQSPRKRNNDDTQSSDLRPRLYDQPLQDVAVQTRELEQFAEARGWHMVSAYIDDGVSGAKDSRPELNRLMADAHKRRFDVVAV